MAPTAYEEVTVVPRIAIRLPLPLPIPDGFDPARPESWPVVAGRLEYVHGCLLYMPPCGDRQQQTAADVVTELNLWCRRHPEYVVGGNEAGMPLGGEVRAAEAAVWRRVDLGESAGGFPRTAPILVAEVAGKDEGLDDLVEKAAWYFGHGVKVVWILLPETRSLVVLTPRGRVDLGIGQGVGAHASLPGLEPRVEDLFRQAS
ncbi:MAG: Uma2 family endonuclease [Deltaproteobacteria bacterium]|nr:Uma2 family endonuclease [Deltaproteobacteria bacterium]